MQKIIVATSAVLFFTVVGYYVNVTHKTGFLKAKNIVEADMEISSVVPEKDSIGIESAQLAGTYETYNPAKLTSLSNEKIILFFKADWCASCSVIDEQVLSSLQKIPAGVHIFKVDFDKEIELRKKYGVTVQHTFVQVDEHGEMRGKWSGGLTLDDILTQIK